MFVSCTSAVGMRIEALTGFEQVVLELRQLARAGERFGVGHGRAPPFLVAARGVRVGHEVDEGALQACGLAAQQDEAALSQLHATLGLEHVQVGAQVPVRLHLDALGGEIAGVPQRRTSGLSFSSSPTGVESAGMFGVRSRMSCSSESAASRLAETAASWSLISRTRSLAASALSFRRRPSSDRCSWTWRCARPAEPPPR